MRNFVSIVAVIAIASGLFLHPDLAHADSSDVVISQVYGGGGNSSAKYTHDYVELFNAGGSPVDIGGWSVQYASTAGTNWSGLSTIPANTMLQPGQYYLVQESAGSGTGSTPDVAPDPSSGSFNMAAGHGNLALVDNASALSGKCGSDDPSGIVDFVGWGSAKCNEGSATAPAPGNNTQAAIRKHGGCQDTDDNGADFIVDTAAAHNRASPVHACPGTGNDILASIADVSHAEGDSATTPFDFTVTLSQPAPAGGVDFDMATSDGTATTADNDYAARSETDVHIAEGETTAGFQVLANGDTKPEPDETFLVTADNFRVDASYTINDSATATGTIENDDGTFSALIYDIQGTPATQGPNNASPYFGQTVHTSGIVTVIDPGNGFYLQTPDDEAANKPADASSGVYVFDNGDHAVAPGDAVEFDAEVDEYYTLTELKNLSNFTLKSSGNALPGAVHFDAATPSPDPDNLSCGTTNFECYEGMLVHIADGIVSQASGYSSKHTYDYLYVTASGKRSLREPGVLYGLSASLSPDNAAAGMWDGNPEVFEVSPNEFPASMTGYDGDTTPVTGGSSFTATGVIGYSFGAYQFYPSELDITQAAPVPRAVPAADSGILRIGDFNVERFCDDVDDTQANGGDEIYECAGSTPPSTAEYNDKARRLADYIETVLHMPDVVALQEVENIDVLRKLAGVLYTRTGIDYRAKLVEGNEVSGIDVGFLVNPDRVLVFSVHQLDKDLLWHTHNGHDYPLFGRVPLVLQGVFTGAGLNQGFQVMVNHLKARQNVDDASNGTPTPKAATDREKRFRQAVAVAKQVQRLQGTYSIAGPQGLSFSPLARPNAAAQPTPLVVLGDFNAYQFTDGWADMVGMISGCYDFGANLWDLSDLTAWDLKPIPTPWADANIVNPPLWDALYSLPENERYSYLYASDFGAIQGYGLGGAGSRKVPANQALDHALLNKAAQDAFVRMDYGRANVDAASQDIYNSTGAVGVSDHDGFVLQLSFDRIFQSRFEQRMACPYLP